jgi:mono/diheme cytochrome c family protein
VKISETEGKGTSRKDTITRGKYLVTAMGCGDCHSPKVFGPKGMGFDTTRALSGHPSDQPIAPVDKSELKSWILFNPHFTAIAGPWGVSYAANITSDPTGIGNWTEKQFFTAIRKGKYKGIEKNRDLLPPMPWPNFAHLSDDDLKAIFVYLKSTKPVRNIVPAPKSPKDL